MKIQWYNEFEDEHPALDEGKRKFVVAIITRAQRDLRKKERSPRLTFPEWLECLDFILSDDFEYLLSYIGLGERDHAINWLFEGQITSSIEINKRDG